MPEIEVKYPDRFLKRFGKLTHAFILLEQSEYPMGKKAGHWENKIFRKIFLVLALSSSMLLLLLNSICNKVFKIKNNTL